MITCRCGAEYKGDLDRDPEKADFKPILCDQCGQELVRSDIFISALDMNVVLNAHLCLLCNKLGWPGGTIWQVIKEVERLRSQTVKFDGSDKILALKQLLLDKENALTDAYITIEKLRGKLGDYTDESYVRLEVRLNMKEQQLLDAQEAIEKLNFQIANYHAVMMGPGEAITTSPVACGNEDVAMSDNPLKEFIHFLVELHFLSVAGKNDSPEADVIRDKMDKPWKQLTSLQVNCIYRISTALGDLEDEEATEEK